MAPQLGRHDYTVGWICALPVELAAVAKMMDEEHHNLQQDSTDTNSYLFGRIGEHDVVAACPPAGQMGASSVAEVVNQMTSSFPSIRFGLMVGIGGGVPSEEADIRLGDVVISQPSLQYGGLVQYDFGKTETEGRFTRTGSSNVPPTVLLAAISKLRSNYMRGRARLLEHLSALDRLPVFAYQGTDQDTLYKPTCNHVGGSTCDDCRGDEKVERIPRQNTGVVLHFGTIASGNRVMKDAVTRDRLSAELGGVLCFEMEAAGFMNNFPCLVIRGICDYADSHKNSTWQPYAAATAAACAKEILMMIPKYVNKPTGNTELQIDLGSHFGSMSAFCDSAYGSAESVQAYGTAVDEFMALLINDTILSNVFETTVGRLGAKTFEKRFTETLGTYFRELEHVAKKDIEYDAVYILRRRVAYISSEIRDLYAEDNDKNMDKFRQQAPDKSVQLNKWLEKKYGEPVDEIDLDRSGDEDNEADINQLEPDQQPQSLQHVREFLASGHPFLNLRESCCRVMSDLNLPTDVVCVVWVVMALEAWKTRYLHRYDVPNDQSVISLGHGLKRIRWKCMCGYQFQEDVFEHKLNAAANFVQAIDQGHLQGAKSPLHWYAIIEHLSERIHKLLSRPSSTIELPSYNIYASPVTPCINKAYSSYSGASKGDQTASTAAELAVDKTFICFGINQLSGGPYLYQDRTSTTSEPDAIQPSTNGQSDTTDRDMFVSLQAHYYMRRPWWSRMISCIELSEVKFYEFQLYPNPTNEIEISDDWHDRLPKEETMPPPDQVWNYSPRERDITPFLSPKALTHYVNHPEHCKKGKFWWDRVPKKTLTELTCPGAKPQPGWGLIFKERWAFRWYLILWLPFVIFSLLTAILLVHYSHSPWGAAFTVMGGVTAFISWAWNVQQIKVKQKGLS